MKRALITGVTGQDGSYLAELLLEQGYEVHGIVRRSSTENFDRINHLAGRIHLHQADLLDQLSIIDVMKASEPVRGVQPRRPELRAHQLEAAGAHRRVHRHRRDADARSHPAVRQGHHPLLPGVQSSEMFGKVQAVPQAEDTPVLPPLALRGGEAVRPLDHHQLPRELRDVLRERHPVQPRERAPRPRVRHAQGDGRGGPHQTGADEGTAARQPGRQAGLGASPRITCGPCG